MKPVSRKRILERSENNRKVRRGAVRSKAVPTKQRRLPLVRIFLLFAVIGLVTYAGSSLNFSLRYEQAKQLVSRPISQVEVQGEFRFISKETLRTLIDDQREGNFVNADLREIKRRVEEVPWVENVSINRVWPDGIVLKVKEQKPIARWGDSGFINQYGEIVHTQHVTGLTHLPVLYGNEAQGSEITRTYLEIAELLSPKGVNLRGLYLDEKRAWRLQFNDDIEVIAGRDDIIQKLRNFLYVYENKLKPREAEIARVDLRYRSGLAVRWKAQEEKLANSNINKLLVKVN